MQGTQYGAEPHTRGDGLSVTQGVLGVSLPHPPAGGVSLSIYHQIVFLLLFYGLTSLRECVSHHREEAPPKVLYAKGAWGANLLKLISE